MYYILSIFCAMKAVFFTGRVVSGRALGRQIGFPTINLEATVSAPLAFGVYAARVRLGGDDGNNGDGDVDGGAMVPAVIHYGPKPTLGDTNIVLEVHLLGEVPAQIPERVSGEVIGFIRGVVKFDSVTALGAQLARDVALARARYFARAE